MKNLSIFEPQIEKHYVYKKTCNTNFAPNISAPEYKPPEYKSLQKCLWTFISPGLIFGILRYFTTFIALLFQRHEWKVHRKDCDAAFKNDQKILCRRRYSSWRDFFTRKWCEGWTGIQYGAIRVAGGVTPVSDFEHCHKYCVKNYGHPHNSLG